MREILKILNFAMLGFRFAAFVGLRSTGSLLPHESALTSATQAQPKRGSTSITHTRAHTHTRWHRVLSHWFGHLHNLTTRASSLTWVGDCIPASLVAPAPTRTSQSLRGAVHPDSSPGQDLACMTHTARCCCLALCKQSQHWTTSVDDRE
jgi:hypothetical protein